MIKFNIQKGDKFHHLTVIRRDNVTDGHRHYPFICECVCGKRVRVLGHALAKGVRKSCGCKTKDYMRAAGHRRRGKTRPGTWKGDIRRADNPIYGIWLGMRQRCYNLKSKSFPRYGGRGITISEDWQNFELFDRDMRPSYKEGLTIERIDNDRGYSKENCKWVTWGEQARNTRKTIKYGNAIISSVSVKIGGSPKLISDRVSKLGWTLERALATPVRASKKISEL